MVYAGESRLETMQDDNACEITGIAGWGCKMGKHIGKQKKRKRQKAAILQISYRDSPKEPESTCSHKKALETVENILWTLWHLLLFAVAGTALTLFLDDGARRIILEALSL